MLLYCLDIFLINMKIFHRKVINKYSKKLLIELFLFRIKISKISLLNYRQCERKIICNKMYLSSKCT